MTSSASARTVEIPTLAGVRARRDEILRIAARRGVSNVRIFGSVVRGDATPESDIDLLVDFTPAHGGLDLFGFAREVTELLGHAVDVGTEIHPVIRQRVAREAVPL
ncbi:MAG: nucleotidyltransferase family protein [Actinomycetota bacterium]|nr:nucleotidyltransferase family protein [Actinomycetota bacterium]MDQ6949204.1 nucleotidyltransferase family protein [Actinomycetota bacterium]